MTDGRDLDHLLHRQYKDSTNFNARVELHRRFSVNKYGWHRWVFDQLGIEPDGSVLELGCGPGRFWFVNRQRIPAGWRITLSDFSPGMLQEARQHLGESRFAYRVIDAQAIPYANASFDAVIANHMLYHIPDLPRALAEIQRVLKPCGRLYATTIGREHLFELNELIRRAWPDISWQGFGEHASFALENGREVLAPFFTSPDPLIYENSLDVTEIEPLLAYVYSTVSGSRLRDEDEHWQTLKAVLEQELAAHNVIHIRNPSGIFVALRKDTAHQHLFVQP